MADFSRLTAARDKLNADIAALVSAGSVAQSTVDALADEVTSTDADVVSASAPPPPPPPGPLDFSAFNAAVAAFVADTKLTQAQVDAQTAAVTAATV